MVKKVKYDEVKTLVGQEVGVSDWVEITQDQINQFADATGDHQWIHVDVERAKKEMPTKNTIAHGYLTLSLIPKMMSEIMQMEGVSRGINYGCNKVRFTNMVPTGSKVRGREKVLNVEERGGGISVTYEMTIEIEGQDRPACIAEVIMMAFP